MGNGARRLALNLRHLAPEFMFSASAGYVNNVGNTLSCGVAMKAWGRIDGEIPCISVITCRRTN